MIVLHAAIHCGALAIWGEQSSQGEGGAKTRARRGGPHPCAAPAESLAEALAATGVALDEAEGAVVHAWLPSTSAPLPSTTLLGEAPKSRRPVALAPWSVEAVLLPIDEEAALLALCDGRRTLAPGVLPGPELAAWRAVWLMGESLAARHRALPGVRREGRAWRALWEPVPAPTDAAAMGALAAALPAAARCLGEARAAPTTSGRAAVGAFIERHVDARLRRGLRAPPPRRDFDSVHDQWAHALRTADGTLVAPASDLDALAADIAAWRAPLQREEAAPWRLCFRLEEPPPEGGATWTVRPLVHPQDDPSLLVPVEALFLSTAEAATLARAVARPGGDARTFALAALARAAAAVPVLAGALGRTPPRAVGLDGASAWDFVTDGASALEVAGFGVMLPAWFAKGTTAPRLTVRAEAAASPMVASAGLHMNAIVEVDWRIALGEDPLTPEELEELAAIKAPMVRLRGQWVVVDAERIRDALKRWNKRSRDRLSVRELAQAALGVSDHGLPVTGVTADGPLGELLARLTGATPPPELAPPPGFTGTLRPYQSRGLAWLAFLTDLGMGACLADDMGLGKTVQTLALVERGRQRDPRPVLLVCPTSLLANWQKEAARFAPDLPVRIHHGATRSLEALETAEGLVLASYGVMLRDADQLRRVQWAGVVLDEAQAVKNAGTRQARAARTIPAGWRVALTGTPVENHVGELWSILDLVNPGLLGSASAFRDTFFTPIQSGDRQAAARLKRLTGPFVLRRLKTDPGVAPDLPDKIETTVTCTLTKEQATLYAAILREADAALAEAEGMQRRGLVLSTITKLKQVCNHPAQLLGDASSTGGRSGKLERTTEILDEVVEAGDAALVFTQFAEMGHLLQRHLGDALGVEIPFLHGGVARTARDAMVERFQSPGGPPILLLSLKAGGTGLNLTRATHVVHYDRWWNPAVEGQASDRAYRIGQKRTVEIHTLVCAGTFEERIDALLRRKRAVAERVVGTGEAWLTELSDDELRDVLALRATGEDGDGD